MFLKKNLYKIIEKIILILILFSLIPYHSFNIYFLFASLLMIFFNKIPHLFFSIFTYLVLSYLFELEIITILFFILAVVNIYVYLNTNKFISISLYIISLIVLNNYCIFQNYFFSSLLIAYLIFTILKNISSYKKIIIFPVLIILVFFIFGINYYGNNIFSPISPIINSLREYQERQDINDIEEDEDEFTTGLPSSERLGDHSDVETLQITLTEEQSESLQHSLEKLDLSTINFITVFLSICMFLYFLMFFITSKSYKSIKNYYNFIILVSLIFIIALSGGIVIRTYSQDLLDIGEIISQISEENEMGSSQFHSPSMEIEYVIVDSIGERNYFLLRIFNLENLFKLIAVLSGSLLVLITYFTLRTKKDPLAKKKKKIEEFLDVQDKKNIDEFEKIELAYKFIRNTFFSKYYYLTPKELLLHVDHPVDFKDLTDLFMLKEYGNKKLNKNKIELNSIIKNSIEYFKKYTI